MQRSLALLVVLLLGLPSCSDLDMEPYLPSRLDDIREAVFRYQFLHNASAQQQGASVYFLGLYTPFDSLHPSSWADPPERLMARFFGSVPPVKRYSECNHSMNGVFNRVTGDPGLLFRIESVDETSENEVEVLGGYFETGGSASLQRYTVRRIDGRWSVVKDVILGIS